MRDIITVMKFTMKDMIKRKSFIISTIIILFFIIIGFNIPNIIKSFSGDDTKNKMIITDKDNIYEGTLDSLNQLDLGYEIVVSDDNYESIKELITNEKIDSAIVIEKNNDSINMNYIVKNATFSSGPDTSLTEALTALYKNIQIQKLGLDEDTLIKLNPVFNYNISQIDEEAHGNVLVMMFLSIALFYAIYFCAYQVSSSITVEKTSKIIETLVTSTSPKNIVLGKTLGIGFVGLCQLILYLVTAIICANIFIDKETLSVVFDLSSITIGLGLITLLYFILGYFTFALLYALTGSTVSKPEDIQSANSPVAIIAVIGFYLSYFTMMNPASELNKLAALLPISSPFCAPFRIMMGMSSTEEILLSIAILVVTILVIAKVTIKIYSNAILNYGTKMSIKNIVSMYKQK